MGYEIDDDGSVNNNQFEVEDTTSIEMPVIGPHFDYTAFRNVTTLVGNTVYLKCRVRKIGNKTVSWVRHRDIHLLTVGKFSYTSDNRFQCIHDVDAEEWILKVSNKSPLIKFHYWWQRDSVPRRFNPFSNISQLRYPQIKDSGFYECQISTTPPRGYPVYLSVVGEYGTVKFPDEVEGDLNYVCRAINDNYRRPRSLHKYRFHHQLNLHREKLAWITVRHVLDSQQWSKPWTHSSISVPLVESIFHSRTINATSEFRIKTAFYDVPTSKRGLITLISTGFSIPNLEITY